MELKDFIKTALIDIHTAVCEAQDELAVYNERAICPVMSSTTIQQLKAPVDVNGRYHQNIEFDVAVTATETSGTDANASAKAGIKVLGASATISETITSGNSTVSRIKFHVPIALEPRKITG